MIATMIAPKTAPIAVRALGALACLVLSPLPVLAEKADDFFHVPSVARVEAGGSSSTSFLSGSATVALKTGWELDGFFERVNYREEEDPFIMSKVEGGLRSDPLKDFSGAFRIANTSDGTQTRVVDGSLEGAWAAGSAWVFRIAPEYSVLNAALNRATPLGVTAFSYRQNGLRLASEYYGFEKWTLSLALASYRQSDDFFDAKSAVASIYLPASTLVTISQAPKVTAVTGISRRIGKWTFGLDLAWAETALDIQHSLSASASAYWKVSSRFALSARGGNSWSLDESGAPNGGSFSMGIASFF